LRSRLVPLALVALLAFPAFAHAAGTAPTAASSDTTPGQPLDVAIARDGSVLAVSTAKPIDATVPAAPRTVTNGEDLIVYNASGRMFHDSSRDAASRTHVEVSAGGTRIASLLAPSTGGVTPRPTMLRYNATGTLGNFSAALTGTPVALAMSADGRIMASATWVEAEDRGTVWVHDATSVRRLAVTDAGRVNDVAVSADGNWVLAGGRLVTDNRNFGYVKLFRVGGSSSDAPVFTGHVDEPDGRGEILDVHLSADGGIIVASTVSGRIVSWPNVGAATAGRIDRLATGDANLRHLAASDDGRRLYAAGDASLFAFAWDESRLAYRLLWNASRSAVTSLATDAAGSYVAAASPAGITAHAASRAATLWTAAGGFKKVALSGPGDVLAGITDTKVERFLVAPAISATLSGPAPSTQPYKSVTTTVSVKNTGARPDTLTVELPALPEMRFSANVTRLANVEPGETRSVAVTIHAERVSPGAYAANVTFRSATRDNAVSVAIPVNVGAVTGVTLQLTGSAERTIAKGRTDTIYVTLRNVGNAPADVSLALDQKVSDGPFWAANLEPKSTSVAVNAITTAQVAITVPPTAANGTTNLFTVIARTPQGVDQVTVLYTVNPTLGVNLSVPSRGLFVEVGRFAVFNLTVKNTGSVPTLFEVIYDAPRIVGGKNWVVDVDSNAFLLPAGQSTLVPVYIFSPQDGVAGDRYAVKVYARSIPRVHGDPIAEENITLFANLNARATNPTPPTTVVLPAPGLALALAAIVGVAALAASRRGGRSR